VGEERGQPATLLIPPHIRASPAILAMAGLEPFIQENIMASIVIKDLSDNLELDRKAMRAITGGSRAGSSSASRSQLRAAGTAPLSAPRIVDFRTGAVARSTADKKTK
jgi:hypothetical protein